MEYVYAALLLNSAGKEINEETLSKVVEATGSEADEAKIKSLTTALEDIDIEEAVKKQAIAQAAPVKQEASEEPEEEEEEDEDEEEEVSEEEAAEGLGALFE